MHQSPPPLFSLPLLLLLAAGWLWRQVRSTAITLCKNTLPSLFNPPPPLKCPFPLLVPSQLCLKAPGLAIFTTPRRTNSLLNVFWRTLQLWACGFHSKEELSGFLAFIVVMVRWWIAAKGKTNQHRPAVPAAADTRSISELTKMILTHGPREREAAAAAGRCCSHLCVCLSFYWDFVFLGLSMLVLNRRCALNGLKEI